MQTRQIDIVPDQRPPDERATTGDSPLARDEFDALAVEHRAGAVRFAIGFLRDRHLAEDMVQEGLRRLYEVRDKYPLRTLFGPYLVKTVARACIDLRRSRLAERRRVAALPARNPPPATVPLERSETAAQVGAAVAALPDRERACFLLTVCEGLSYADAAEALGLSFAQVNNAIHRARGTLRASLGPLVADEPRNP
jgi:RNA polymerase sigma factor (sigma-70 family)